MSHATQLNPAVETAPSPSEALPPQRWRLGGLATFLLLGWLLVELFSAFTPLSWLGVNPWQAARRPTGFAPFLPDFQLVESRPIGEEAVMANLTPQEGRTPVTFVTDSLGFRQTPTPTPGRPPRVIAYEGDSFIFGAALSQEQTLPAALARQMGVGVYNAARFHAEPEEIKQFQWLQQELGAERPIVVYGYLERFDLSVERSRLRSLVTRYAGEDAYSRLQRWRFLANYYKPLQERSPVKIAAVRAHKRLANGRLLPNVYRDRVAMAHFANGRRMLLEPDLIRRYAHPADDETLERTADHLEEKAQQFREQGINAVILLIPDRLSVYGPYLQLEQRPPDGQPAYLDRLEASLARRGVLAVNGLHALRPYAAQDVAADRLSYFLEDHHWSPQGVERVATALATAVRPLLAKNTP